MSTTRQPGRPRFNLAFIALLTGVLCAVAFVAVAPGAYLSRSTQYSAAPPPPKAEILPDDLRLRGAVKDTASVCASVTDVAETIPNFRSQPDEFNPAARDLTAETARRQLVKLTATVSADTASPLRPAVEEWVANKVLLLNSVQDRATDPDLEWVRRLDQDLMNRINAQCQ